MVTQLQVMVEVNTTKEDSFFYDPLWDEPVVKVMEADYMDGVEEDEVDGAIGTNTFDWVKFWEYKSKGVGRVDTWLDLKKTCIMCFWFRRSDFTFWSPADPQQLEENGWLPFQDADQALWKSHPSYAWSMIIAWIGEQGPQKIMHW